MAGELCLKHTASGSTIKALVLSADRTKRWNGGALVAVDDIADVDWATGMIACAEQLTATGTPTARYVGDFPAGIEAAGEYVVEYYVGAAPTPGQRIVGIQTVYWTGTAQTVPTDKAVLDAAKAVTDKLNTTMEPDGMVHRFTANALEQAPAGGGGGTTAIAFALQSTVGAGQVADGSITLYQGEAIAGIVIVVEDQDGNPVDLSAATLVFVVYKDPATVLWSLTEAAGQLTVGGASNNQVTLAADDTNTATAGHFRYALWDTATDLVRARGVLTIEREASAPQG